jgi:single-strand DNA-binding protein
MNLVILKGNLTADPEVKFLPNGTPVAKFTVAVNESYKAKDGTKKEEVLFASVEAFGKRAEVVQKCFSKGSPIIVTGKLRIDVVEKDGQRRYFTKIRMQSFEFCGGSRKQAAAAPAQGWPPAQAPAAQVAAPQSMDWGSPGPSAPAAAPPTALPTAAELPW